MLTAARDKNGSPWVFRGEVEMRGDHWCSKTGVGSANIILSGDDAEHFCVGLDPCESRVIDLSASTIVHVQPKKTAVEDLVEKAENLCGACRQMACGDYYAPKKLFTALSESVARVRQEERK